MRRLLGLGAVVGFVVALLLGVIQSNIFNGPAAPGWVQAFTPWLELANEWRESLPLSTGDYYFFGRIFFVVYLLTIGGFVAWQQRTDTALPTRPASYPILLIALALALVGDVASYWGGIGQFNTVQGLGFAVELLALAIAGIATSIYGWQLRRMGAQPRPVTWPLILTFPLAVVVLFALGYAPHGPMIAISAASAVVGAVTLTAPRAPPA